MKPKSVNVFACSDWSYALLISQVEISGWWVVMSSTEAKTTYWYDYFFSSLVLLFFPPDVEREQQVYKQGFLSLLDFY